jgi:hypothetical protein
MNYLFRFVWYIKLNIIILLYQSKPVNLWKKMLLKQSAALSEF